MNEFVAKANEIHSYFKSLAEEADSKWRIEVEASARWVTLLNRDENTDDVQEFLIFLESENEKHGSGWLDLQCEVRRWLLLKVK